MSLDLIIDFQPYEMTIEDQKITMELRPLTREYMIILSKMFNDLPIEKIKTDKNKKISSEQALKMYEQNLEYQKYADPIFKNHVRNIKGLTINGKPPTDEMFANEPALCNIVLSILTELVIRSNLSFNKVKN